MRRDAKRKVVKKSLDPPCDHTFFFPFLRCLVLEDVAWKCGVPRSTKTYHLIPFNKRSLLPVAQLLRCPTSSATPNVYEESSRKRKKNRVAHFFLAAVQIASFLFRFIRTCFGEDHSLSSYRILHTHTAHAWKVSPSTPHAHHPKPLSLRNHPLSQNVRTCFLWPRRRRQHARPVQDPYGPARGPRDSHPQGVQRCDHRPRRVRQHGCEPRRGGEAPASGCSTCRSSP
ncbi:uncharacterized protein QC761_107590 [Podospora bellae-mahoneyi]|uniref:Uncharacterized protein n=1 Tax=Podospora bellae-mahoneyi TaxID=2093777 RepID=A0ABR0FW31_9PEZI|nr:hypothetical protein QC761_107590 [Podospora bellae-mahoneyi]